MLRNTNDLKDYAIHATDGNIGSVEDCFFDDEKWTVRYLVVDTGRWLTGRKVLISPISMAGPTWGDKTIPVSITKEQVTNSPDIDTHMPVSRQLESRYLGFYGYPSYWGGSSLWASGLYPGMLMPGYGGLDPIPVTLSQQAEIELAPEAEMRDAERADIHLRSCNEVKDYHIHAKDGELGHVEGFLLDEETWAIRYIVVNTSNWWLGHLVLVAPEWIDEIRWLDRTVAINLTRQSIKDAPPYDPDAELSREQEIAIHQHYDRTGYWISTHKREG